MKADVGKRSVLLSLLIGLATGAALTYIYFPKTVTITQTVVEEKVVNKIQTVEKVRVEVKKPDGTVIVTTKDRVKDENTVSELDKRISEKVTLRNTPRSLTWGINAMAALSPQEGGLLRYGLQVEYRAFGPVWVGAFGLGTHLNPWGTTVGLTLGFKF
jgi:hypothetical protein